MKSFGANKKVTSLLIAAFVFVIGFAVFYYVVYPKMQERDSLQYQISDLKSQSKVLEKQLKTLKSNQEAEKKSTAELTTEVPTKRELSSLINSIEQLESVSNTEVLNIAFNNYDATVKETINTDEQNAGTSNENAAANQKTNATPSTNEAQTQDQHANAADQNNTTTKEQQTANQDGEKNAVPVSPIASSSLPDSLKLLTMNLSVSATDKKEIKEFLKEIETLPRIMRIDSVSYATPNTEVTDSSTDTKEDQLQATIQLTTFYYVGQLDDQSNK
ncbi:MAG TPA: hypothetical protein VNU45_10910 [Rummeliibacillus sp.]|nr:hypothetical protein [Rummeliibacillus sp.]